MSEWMKKGDSARKAVKCREKDIEEIRSMVQIGDIIKIESLRVARLDSGEIGYGHTSIRCNTKVIGKYKHFCQTEHPGGQKESILWTEFLYKESRINGKGETVWY